MFVAALFQLGEFSADDQILDGDFALGLFVGALDDHAGTVAPVGVFELVAEVFRIAEIKLGADFCRAQLRHHVLIIGEAVPIEHGNDNRTIPGFAVELAEIFERSGEPRHADGKSGRRHRLAAKARHQSVVTPAPADRTEARRAVLAVGGEVSSTSKTGPV